MRLRLLTTCSLLFALSACCTKEDCPTEMLSAGFVGFTGAELDTVRVIISDIRGQRPPDTIFTQAVLYPPGRDTGSLIGTIPFSTANRYTYFLPATGESYRIDGYEVSFQSCNSCFPKSAESKDHAVLEAYRINDVRHDGRFVTIRK